MSAAHSLVDAHTHLSLRAPDHYPQAMHHVEALLELQRSHGIGASAVYSPMVISQAMHAGRDPMEAARQYNEHIARTQDAHRDEIVGVGIVFPFAGDDSAREAERAVTHLGLRGVMANPYLEGAWLDQDERAEPLFQAVQHLNTPLIVHPEEHLEKVVAQAVGRQLRYDEGLVMWRTLATTWSLYGFAAGPILDRFPALNLIFAHGAGAFWGSATRIEMAFQELIARDDAIAMSQWEGERTGIQPLRRLRERNVYMDTAWMDRGAMRNAIEFLGADKLLYGSDGSPHPNSIGYFQRQLAGLDLAADDRDRIARRNAHRLFSVG